LLDTYVDVVSSRFAVAGERVAGRMSRPPGSCPSSADRTASCHATSRVFAINEDAAPFHPKDFGKMSKKSACCVLARHCRLTGSAAFTNVTRVIPHVVNLSSSPYSHGTRACLGRLGVGKNERFASSLAAGMLDGLFAHPAVMLPPTRHVS